MRIKTKQEITGKKITQLWQQEKRSIDVSKRSACKSSAFFAINCIKGTGTQYRPPLEFLSNPIS